MFRRQTMYNIINNEQAYGYEKFKAFATLFDTAPLVQNETNQILNQLQRRFKQNVIHFNCKRKLITGKEVNADEYDKMTRRKRYTSKYKAADVVHVHTNMLLPPRCTLKCGELLMPGRNKQCIQMRDVKYELKLAQKAKRDAYGSLRYNHYDVEHIHSHVPERPKPPCKPKDDKCFVYPKFGRTRLCKINNRVSFVKRPKEPKRCALEHSGRYNSINNLMQNHRRRHSVNKKRYIGENNVKYHPHALLSSKKQTKTINN